MWLGFRYLEKNCYNVTPNFYIIDRISKFDRALILYKLNIPFKGLNFMGSNFPVFSLMPSVFMMLINGIAFINVSTDSAFSRRLGFPYCSEQSLNKDSVSSVTFKEGTDRIIKPIINFNLTEPQLAFYQPILRKGMF